MDTQNKREKRRRNEYRNAHNSFIRNILFSNLIVMLHLPISTKQKSFLRSQNCTRESFFNLQNKTLIHVKFRVRYNVPQKNIITSCTGIVNIGFCFGFYFLRKTPNLKYSILLNYSLLSFTPPIPGPQNKNKKHH